MAVVQRAIKWASEVRSACGLPARRKQTWLEQMQRAGLSRRAGLPAGARITLTGRPRGRGGTYLFRGSLRSGDHTRSFWIKWCPKCSVQEVADVARRVAWWRQRHSELCGPAADLWYASPADRLLVFEGRSGTTLGHRLQEAGSTPTDHATAALAAATRRLGCWIRQFAAGDPPYDSNARALLAREAQLTDQGRCTVDTRRVLEGRLSAAAYAVRRLFAAGLIQARHWQDRFDLERLLSAAPRAAPAGFVHADLKPENILVSGDEFSVIDWWNGPRVRWPMIDVGLFAANLWLGQHGRLGDAVWQSFRQARFEKPLQEQDTVLIDLIATTTCLWYLSSRKRLGAGRPFDRRRIRPLLDRLIDTRTCIGVTEFN